MVICWGVNLSIRWFLKTLFAIIMKTRKPEHKEYYHREYTILCDHIHGDDEFQFEKEVETFKISKAIMLIRL